MTLPAPDIAGTSGERGVRPDRGGALSFPVVAAIFTTLLALGITLAVVIHKSYVGFERVAAHHVPPDTTLVLRWDVEKVSLFEPTRHFLLPLLDAVPGAPNGGVTVGEAIPIGPNAPSANAPSANAPTYLTPSSGASAAKGNTRRDHFAAESGSMIARDLREVVALFGPGEHDWAVVLGGSFPKVDLVAAAGRTLAKERWPWRAVSPGQLVSPGGAALGRAEDGAFVIASSVERLAAVLVDRPTLPEVPRIGAAALRVRPVAPGLPRGAPEIIETLGNPTQVEGDARWGTPMPFEVVLRYGATPAPADVDQRVRRALVQLLGEPDLKRIERQFAPVRVEKAGSQAVDVTVLLDDVALERVANRAAEAVESALGSTAGAGNGL